MYQSRPAWRWTAQNMMVVLAFVSTGAGIFHWGSIQFFLHEVSGEWTLYNVQIVLIASAMTLILGIAPGVFTAFLFPNSPGGMLLQKIQSGTWGYWMIATVAGFYLLYSWMVFSSWYAARETIQATGMVTFQTLAAITGYIILPALCWAPLATSDIVEQLRQAHLVRRYRLQTQADIAILRATLLRAQEKALKGFANLTVRERQELAGVMKALVTSIAASQAGFAQNVRELTGVAAQFETDDRDDIIEMLTYIEQSLVGGNLSDPLDQIAPMPTEHPFQAQPPARKRFDPSDYS